MTTASDRGHCGGGRRLDRPRHCVERGLAVHRGRLVDDRHQPQCRGEANPPDHALQRRPPCLSQTLRSGGGRVSGDGPRPWLDDCGFDKAPFLGRKPTNCAAGRLVAPPSTVAASAGSCRTTLQIGGSMFISERPLPGCLSSGPGQPSPPLIAIVVAYALILTAICVVSHRQLRMLTATCGSAETAVSSGLVGPRALSRPEH
jgi:hypothetical protein